MKEINLKFLENWENLNPIELEAIKTLNKGIGIIFNKIPKQNITTIYLKGSFARREMKKDSDVDVALIVNSDEALRLLNELQIEYRHSNKLNFEFSGYSIEELKTGKLSPSGKSMRAGPARFTRLIPSYILIYGDELNLEELRQKTDLEHLRNFINAFHNIFFPACEKKELGFDDMVKQVLWLFELETAVRNQKFKFKSWEDLLNYFDKEHFIYEVLNLRKSKNISQKQKEEFVIKLKSYLKKLKEEFN